MKLTVITEPIHYIVIEDFYDDKELEMIWAELDYYQTNPMILNSKTAPATTSDNIPLTQKSGAFCHDVFVDRGFSNIQHVTMKLFTDGLIFKNPHSWFFKELMPQHHNVLVSYYEDGGYYKRHSDKSVLSIVNWLYKDPKKFKGGDFHFPDYGIKIECKHNSVVAFPGQIMHAVDSVKMDEDDMNQGLGRYSLTVFVNTFN